MALVVKDRVQETTTTTGTGTVTLAGAVTGFQTFSVIGDGNTTYYAITSGNDWEVGLGTYTASGTSNVFVTYPAEKSGHKDADNTLISEQVGATNGIFVNNATVSSNYSIPSGYNGLTAGPVTVNGGVSVTVPSGSKWVVV